MTPKISFIFGAIGVVTGIGGVFFGFAQCKDSQQVKEQNQILKEEVVNTRKEVEIGRQEVSELKYELDKASSTIMELRDSLFALKDTLLVLSNEDFYMHADFRKAIINLVEGKVNTRLPLSSNYSKTPSSIESQNSDIMASSTGGIYWVIIGYSSTAEDAQRQANLAQSRGFKNAWYNEPIRGNPYYGIYAAGNLSWDAAVKLRDLAKNTFYGSEAWIWQP